MKPGILVICYNFPPYPGIGGRRWAKFAKELHAEGYKVHVISSKNPFKSESVWTKETRMLSQSLLPLNYPSALILFPKDLYGKIRYKLGILVVKLFSKGNYYDRTIFWDKTLKAEVKKRVKLEGFRHILITGAPFYLFKIGAELKKELPELKLIADIRDPWTNNQSAYGFGMISKKRLNLEKEWERTVFKNYNNVIAVNNNITNYFRKLYPADIKKFLTIPNGYDPSELDLIEETGIRLDPTKVNLVFAGSFYEKAIYLFDNLINALHSLGNKHHLIHFYFYGPNAEILRARTPDALKGYYSFGWFDSVAKTNSVIKAADFGMLFLTDDINNSFSTKFCEYVKFRKPIVLFAKPGETSEFITNSKLGYVVAPGTELKSIEELLVFGKTIEFPSTFRETDYSIPVLAKKVGELLQ